MVKFQIKYVEAAFTTSLKLLAEMFM